MYLELVFFSLILCIGVGLFADTLLVSSQRFSFILSGLAVVVFLLIIVAASSLLLVSFGVNALAHTDTAFAPFSAEGASGVFWSKWQFGTVLSALLPVLTFFTLTLTRHTLRVVSALVAMAYLIGAGLVFIFSTNLVVTVASFELLLLISLYLLRLTSKSERILEATTEMFFWTLVGSLGLLLGLVLVYVSGLSQHTALYTLKPFPGIISGLFLLGFGVKLPVWPCFSWLLRAHVEASVEFSILLSGVVVKFGALGLHRVLTLTGGSGGHLFLLSCCTLGILEAAVRLLAQRDLKRIVALTTVIEVNWLGVCLGFGGSQFDGVGVLVLIAHSFTTTAEFLLVECLYRRYRTRDLLGLTGLAAQAPSLQFLSFLNVLTTIGFPGTSLFAAKFLFFIVLVQTNTLLFFLFILCFVLFLPLVFLRIWVPIWYGQFLPTVACNDLNSLELTLLSVAFLGGVCLGLYPAIGLHTVGVLICT